MDVSPEQWDTFIHVLQRIADAPSSLEKEERVKGLIAKIHREGKKGTRQAVRHQKQAEDRQRQEATAIVQAQRSPLPTTSHSIAANAEPVLLNRPAQCYICKLPFTELHSVYHLLCPTCADQNDTKRHQRVDLTGRQALITGGRLKIGYYTALRLLRDGASVLITTRFPADAARRFASEDDFEAWADHLRIYGIDLRNIPAVEAFAQSLLATEPALDILIHNAAQTVKRPSAFYHAECVLEQQQDRLTPEARALIINPTGYRTQITESIPTILPQLMAPSAEITLPDVLDADGQPLDLRAENSWALRLSEVSAVEMLEVQLVNVVAPFLLNGRLKSLMQRSPFSRRFIINVSAMEGQFNRRSKTDRHPHTNMAKAALNMMTRTSAQEYARDGIYMNSVDTGWITEENPQPQKMRLQEERGFYTPLHAEDGAARIIDPIVQGIRCPEEPLYGHFLKDYAPYPW